MLMKLFKKSKEKKKKTLSDKAKEERKQKIKKIVKRVLDILVYGFAIFMIFGLLLGSCNSRSKVVSAYYHNDNGYTSLNSVVVGGNTTLRYYYDYNYNKTFPNFTTHLACYRNSTATTINLGLVYIDNDFAIDDTSFHYLGLRFFGSSSSTSSKYVYYLRNNGEPEVVSVPFLEVYTSTINVLRADILTSLFSGAYTFSPVSDTSFDALLYKFLVYYFGELGYNRITYDFPVNVSELSYLFVDSIQETNLIENGYFFKNDNFPSDYEVVSTNPTRYGALTTIYNVFVGSFRSNGVYYSGIDFHFTSVFGNTTHNNPFNTHRRFHMKGSINRYISSDDEFYRGYWYLDSIHYTTSTIDTIVWRSSSETSDSDGSDTFINVDFNNANWVGDTYYSSTQYRSLYIYYALAFSTGSGLYPFNEYFPQLNNFSFADFLNFIGEAYPSGNVGVPQDNTSPFTSVFSWLKSALSGIMPLFGYMLIPGISIGTLIMVPITMTIILFVVKLFKR